MHPSRTKTDIQRTHVGKPQSILSRPPALVTPAGPGIGRPAAGNPAAPAAPFGPRTAHRPSGTGPTRDQPDSDRPHPTRFGPRRLCAQRSRPALTRTPGTAARGPPLGHAASRPATTLLIQKLSGPAGPPFYHKPQPPARDRTNRSGVVSRRRYGGGDELMKSPFPISSRERAGRGPPAAPDASPSPPGPVVHGLTVGAAGASSLPTDCPAPPWGAASCPPTARCLLQLRRPLRPLRASS